jgi:hypothetical protein
MSGKNRAFALAAATAALVGLSAPVAGAATLQGPSGFNNDSVLNLSGNQVPIQLCNNDIPINALGVQVPLSAISAVLGVLNSGALTGSASKSCTQNPSETNTSTTSTGTTVTTVAGPNVPTVSQGNEHWNEHRNGHWNGHRSGTTTTGFNNDSVLNVSGNQLPVQACNNDIPVNVAGVQVPVDGVSGVLGLLNSGPLSSSADRTCTQNPTETNTSTTTTGNSITNG